MTLKEYYKIVQERIGQYDSHTFRFKAWLPPIATACVLAAYFRPDAKYPLMIVAFVAVAAVFLSEITIRTAYLRMRGYSKELEELMATDARGELETDPAFGPGGRVRDHNFGFAHKMAEGGTWGEFGKAIKATPKRVLVIVPYMVALLIMILGILASTMMAPTTKGASGTTTVPARLEDAQGVSVSQAIMLVLSVAMFALTVAVVWYAKRTLKASKESLDFFAKPLVRFAGPASETHPCSQSSSGILAHTCRKALIIESALPICIENEAGIGLRIIPEESSEYAKHLTLRPAGRRRADGDPIRTWPSRPRDSLVTTFHICRPVDARNPTQAVDVVIEFFVDYTYRRRPYHETCRTTYTLDPTTR